MITADLLLMILWYAAHCFIVPAHNKPHPQLFVCSGVFAVMPGQARSLCLLAPHLFLILLPALSTSAASSLAASASSAGGSTSAPRNRARWLGPPHPARFRVHVELASPPSSRVVELELGAGAAPVSLVFAIRASMLESLRAWGCARLAGVVLVPSDADLLPVDLEEIDPSKLVVGPNRCAVGVSAAASGRFSRWFLGGASVAAVAATVAS